MLKKNFIKNAAWLAGAQYGSAAIGLFTTLAVSRLLGPEQFGFTALVTSYTGLLWTFASFKTASVTTRYIAGFYAANRMKELGGVCKLGYAIDIASTFITVSIVLATASLFADSCLNKSFLAPYMIIHALSLPLYVLSATSRTIFLSIGESRMAALFLIAERALLLAITVILLFAIRKDFATAIIAQSLSQALTGIAMFIAASAVLQRHGVRLFNAHTSDACSVMKEIRRLFAWNYFLTTVSGLISQLPVLLLGRYHSADEAGFYKIASSINNCFSYSESSLRRVAYPELSIKRETMSQEELLSYSKRIGKKFGFPLALLTIAALVSIVWILPFLFGNKYIEVIPAAQIMLIGSAVSGYFFWVESYYFTLGALKPWAIQYTAVHILAAVVIVTAAPFHGVVFFAATAVLAKISFNIISAAGAGRVTGKRQRIPLSFSRAQ